MKIGLPRRRSENMQDRRGQQVPGRTGGFPLPIGLAGAGGLPIGVIVLVVLVMLMQGQCSGGGSGFDVGQPFDQQPGNQAAPAQGLPGAPDPDAALVDFVSFVLDDVQAFWGAEFQRADDTYEPAQLVIFTDAVESGCGVASSDSGPFYCSLDETAYLDLSFFQELNRRFGAPGDFAQGYVIAHEIAHHVQNQTGVSAEVRRLSRENPDDANELSVRQELQADCLAGVWGYSTYERGILETGDLEEGLTAAAAIGDDRIQRQATGRIDPETWTHGSSEQRVRWFRQGFESGDPSECDTFAGDI